ncbi:MAG: c-type cytochrome [Pirellulaceae bacterium]|nr:c-type cytochrome [Pirellulaceae bacterium]
MASNRQQYLVFSMAVVLAVVALAVGTPCATWAQTAPSSATPAAMKIVQLLWTAQPAGAAGALEKALDQAVSRREVESLKPHLTALEPKFLAAISKGPSDVRWVSSVAALALVQNPRALELISAAVTGQLGVDPPLPLAKRELLLRCWQVADRAACDTYIHQLLSTEPKTAKPQSTGQQSVTDVPWLETVALRALQWNSVQTSDSLLAGWSTLPRPVQLAVIEPMTQQAATMKRLVAAIEAGRVAKDLLNTNQLRKWNAGSDGELVSAIERVWGKLRAMDDADRKAVVTRMMALLTSGKAGNPVAGEAHFKRICAQCHRLHGEGIEVGPDITANGRGSFEQLVSNVMDPSLVIGKAFMAKTVLTADGRVLAGLVAAEDPKRLTLKVQGGKLIELDREEEIDEIKESVKSLMPDGLEQQMNEQELIDLFAYLSLAKPLSAAENELIPGTPAKLIAE